MTYCFFNRNNTIDIKLMSDQISLIKQLGSNGIACLGLATDRDLLGECISVILILKCSATFF